MSSYRRLIFPSLSVGRRWSETKCFEKRRQQVLFARGKGNRSPDVFNYATASQCLLPCDGIFGICNGLNRVHLIHCNRKTTRHLTYGASMRANAFSFTSIIISSPLEIVGLARMNWIRLITNGHDTLIQLILGKIYHEYRLKLII